jgi:hypothetical protein
MTTYRCYFSRAGDGSRKFVQIEANDCDEAVVKARSRLIATAYSSVELFDDDHRLGEIARMPSEQNQAASGR